MRYELDIEPTPKGRPRFTRTGHVYTPKKTKAFEQAVKAMLIAQGAKPLKKGTPLKIELLFAREFLKSWSKKKNDLAMNGGVYPTTKPDVDNYVKAVLDASNGILYEDDAQIIELVARKAYKPKASITIDIQAIE